MNLADRLAAARTRANLTWPEVSDRTGISVGHLRRLRRGAGPPTVDTVAFIARVLRVRAAWLAFGDGEP